MEVSIDEKKVKLYQKFLSCIWDKITIKHKVLSSIIDRRIAGENEYHTLFFMITEVGLSMEDDAIVLVKWLENNEMPSNIKEMFNEFILERL